MSSKNYQTSNKQRTDIIDIASFEGPYSYWELSIQCVDGTFNLVSRDQNREIRETHLTEIGYWESFDRSWSPEDGPLSKRSIAKFITSGWDATLDIYIWDTDSYIVEVNHSGGLDGNVISEGVGRWESHKTSLTEYRNNVPE